MTNVDKLLGEATAKLDAEAQKLRLTIDDKERRLREELAPLRAQLGEIEDAIARIEGKPRKSPQASDTRAPRGQNRKLILDALKAKPGSTGSAVAAATGIAKPTAYATLAKLVKDGLVAKKQTEAGVLYRPTPS